MCLRCQMVLLQFGHLPAEMFTKVQSLACLPPSSLVSGERAVNIFQESITGVNRIELEQFRKHGVWQILLFMRQLCSERQTTGDACIQATAAWQSAHRCFFSRVEAVSLWKGQIVESTEWERWSSALPCAVRLAGGGEVAAVVVTPLLSTIRA